MFNIIIMVKIDCIESICLCIAILKYIIEEEEEKIFRFGSITHMYITYDMYLAQLLQQKT